VVPVNCQEALTGTQTNSSDDVKIVFPKGWSTMIARAIFPAQDVRSKTAKLIGPKKDQIVSLQVEAKPGKPMTYRYLGKSGKSYAPSQVTYRNPKSG
jgi:hypothetical protein